MDPGMRWGARCKIFSHDPMSGARGQKVLFWYIFSYAKGEKLGQGGMAPKAPLDLLLGGCPKIYPTVGRRLSLLRGVCRYINLLLPLDVQVI